MKCAILSKILFCPDLFHNNLNLPTSSLQVLSRDVRVPRHLVHLDPPVGEPPVLAVAVGGVGAKLRMGALRITR